MTPVQLLTFKEGKKIMALKFTNSKDKSYYLHKNERVTKTGKTVTLYYFSKEVKEGKSLDAVPAGYEISESKNGLPVLKKIK